MLCFKWERCNELETSLDLSEENNKKTNCFDGAVVKIVFVFSNAS